MVGIDDDAELFGLGHFWLDFVVNFTVATMDDESFSVVDCWIRSLSWILSSISSLLSWMTSEVSPFDCWIWSIDGFCLQVYRHRHEFYLKTIRARQQLAVEPKGDMERKIQAWIDAQPNSL